MRNGDYAPRNVFFAEDGRLTVFDPLFRWRVPRHEDLSRFLVAARLQAVQVHTRGLAYGAAGLDRRERAVIEGYCGDDRRRHRSPVARTAVPPTADHPRQVVSARGQPVRSWHARVRKASLHRASECFRDETRRLLRLADRAPDPG